MTSTSNHDPSKMDLKDLFPAHSRKIDILEQRISGPSTLSNDAMEDKAEEEILDSDEDEQPVTTQKSTSEQSNPSSETPSQTTETPKQHKPTRDSTHKYGRFSKEEDRKIIEGYSKFGNKWDEIARWGNLERSSSQISSRFTRKLCKSPSMSATGKDHDPTLATSPLFQNRVVEADDQPPAKQRRLEASTNAGGGTVVGPGPGPGLGGGSSRSEASVVAPTALSILHSTAIGSTAPAGADAITLSPSLPSSPFTSATTSQSPPSSRNGVAQPLDAGGTVAKLASVSTEGNAAELDPWKSERDRIAAIEQGLRERENKLVELENKLKDWEWKLQNKAGEEQAKITDFIYKQLVRRAKAERTLARKKLAEDCARFGHSSYERRGPDMVEVWQDGELFRQLDDQLKALKNTREALEGKKKLLAKKQPNSKTTTDEDADYEEIYKVRITALKREEALLLEERDRLLAPKLLHMKELKRAADEDQSTHSNFPRLHGDRYLLLSLLGKGGFSEVYLGFDLKEMREVACKIHSVNSMWSVTKRQNYTKHAIREYKIHKDLQHSKVVKLYDVFEIDSSSFCTVLEYCDGGDLDSYLKQNKMLSEREAKCIIAQIFSGLKYLNSQKRPIIHYDLKPGNILFQSNGEVKITDFGLSKIMEEDSEAVELTSQGAGTYWYLPPECFEMGGKQPPMISSKVDVWSVGVIFYQLLYGKKPFGNDMSQQKFLSENVAAQTTRVEFPSKPAVSKEAKDFLLKCLTHNQMLRPDVQTCCSDPYLAQVKIGGKKTALIPSASNSNPQMPPPKGNTKRKIEPE